MSVKRTSFSWPARQLSWRTSWPDACAAAATRSPSTTAARTGPSYGADHRSDGSFCRPSPGVRAGAVHRTGQPGPAPPADKVPPRTTNAQRIDRHLRRSARTDPQRQQVRGLLGQRAEGRVHLPSCRGQCVPSDVTASARSASLGVIVTGRPAPAWSVPIGRRLVDSAPLVRRGDVVLRTAGQCGDASR